MIKRSYKLNDRQFETVLQTLACFSANPPEQFNKIVVDRAREVKKSLELQYSREVASKCLNGKNGVVDK